MPDTLIIRNARTLRGQPIAARIEAGRITRLASDLVLAHREREYDAGGSILESGLHDHHLHLLATAASRQSVDVSDAGSIDAIIARLRAAPGTGWVRAVGFDERIGGWPDATTLDQWLPDRPLRLQARTGGWWLLNSEALAHMGGAPWPGCVELDSGGQPTGRIQRGDAWLRERIGAMAVDLAPLGAQFLRWGVTALTDATAHNGPAEAALLTGALSQHLVLMGSEALPEGAGYARGPLKLLIDEDDPPLPEALAARIAVARSQGRSVAGHCVTLGELLILLGALESAGGARAGDRIEHGGIIPASLIGDIAAAGLTVVSNPGFIHDRGDRYLRAFSEEEQADLYRLASLHQGGVRILAGSDAPYGDPNPWVAIRAATDRKTRAGDRIGPDEALTRDAALALYRAQPLAEGVRADLILLDWPQDAGALPEVRMTMLDGKVVVGG